MSFQLVRISRKVGKIHLQRFLLSRLVFFEDEFTLRDLCALYENQLSLEEKCYQDSNFRKKFGDSLEELSKILKVIRFEKGLSPRAVRRIQRVLKVRLEKFLLPKRNYLASKSKINGTYQLLDHKPEGRLKKTLPPKPYIGIGYRDKGSAKDLAKDGSPGWQEVAMSRGPVKNKMIGESDEIPSKNQRRTFRELLERDERGKGDNFNPDETS